MVGKISLSSTILQDYALCHIVIHCDTWMDNGCVFLTKQIHITNYYREMTHLKTLKFVFEYFCSKDRPDAVNLHDKPILTLIISTLRCLFSTSKLLSLWKVCLIRHGLVFDETVHLSILIFLNKRLVCCFQLLQGVSLLIVIPFGYKTSGFAG